MNHPFDAAIRTTPEGPDTFTAVPHPDYANMVGPFGGITAATVLQTMIDHPLAEGHPLALTINYLAPIADGPITITARPVRTNRTNQHWHFGLAQNDGDPVAHGTAVFGVRRDTWGATEATPPAAPAAADLPRAVFPDAIAWAQRYDMRFVTGALESAAAGAPSEDSTSTLWLADSPQRPLDYASLASMTDAFYPRVMLRRGTYVPAGTISLTTYFHATPAEIAAQGTAPVLATARAARFGNGHFDQYGLVWGAGDTLLATTHQIVYYKA